MPDRLTLGFLIGLAVTGGAMLVVWLRHRGAASAVDDPSILLAAPPPGMTAATAAILMGAPTRAAFHTALLDLASRDEIGFVAEGVERGVADVGIAIHGGTTNDPRALMNRRRPAGEGEIWLLGQLQIAAGTPEFAGLGIGSEAARMAAGMATGPALMGALFRTHAEAADQDDAPASRDARMRGLLADGPLDAATLARAYEAKTGHPLSPRAEAAIAAMATAPPVVAADATATTDATHAVDATDATHAVDPSPAPDGTPAPDLPATPGPGVAPAGGATGPADAADAADGPADRFIPARQARTLGTPIFFGTAVQEYAKRHGWIGRLPVVTRILWRAIAAIEVVAGIAIMSTGVSRYSDVVTGIGVGALFGGVATWVAAPRLAHLSPAGGLMRAQLAAYRRTLHQTFASAATISDATGATGLTWLTTPDEAIVWGVGLGLRDDIAALLARSERTDETPPPVDVAPAYVPFWARLRRRNTGSARRSAATAGELFAGIEAIGSGTPPPAGLGVLRDVIRSR